MIDLRDFAREILDKSIIEYSTPEGNQKIIAFLEDNNWFDDRPEVIAGKVSLTDKQVTLYSEPLLQYLNTVEENKYDALYTFFHEKFPATSNMMDEFFSSLEIGEESQYYIMDFLLSSLHKDIFMMTDKEISVLVKKATNELIKAHGDIFTFFLSWLKTRCKTAYKNDYIMSKRISLENQSQAYDFDEYLELLYYLYNEDYIIENDMYCKAAESKNYADTWLYLAIHFICSLRTTDLVRITHPTLPKEPEEVLKEIKNGEFSEADARYILCTITWRLCVLPFTPSKTSNHNNISSVKFTVPEDCEVHIGTLLAICEAHRLMRGIPDEEPLIRKIADYEHITRYMGDEIGSLFLESNFHSRSANKSYLQSIYMLSDEILDMESEGPGVKGYILASMARSHKGSYGQFARTTEIYLKDFKMNGLTPEFVAKELFERGVLSFIPSMLLKIITNGEYNKLSIHKQTELLDILDMSPAEVERTVSINEQARKRSVKVVNEIFAKDYSEKDIINALHNIGSGSAFSKQPECMCLLTAFKRICPFSERQQCVGCMYEISTKSTIILMVSEYNRLSELYDNCTELLEKMKYKNIITDVVLPSMDEVLTCIKEQYEEETFRAIEQLIKENIK